MRAAFAVLSSWAALLAFGLASGAAGCGRGDARPREAVAAGALAPDSPVGTTAPVAPVAPVAPGAAAEPADAQDAAARAALAVFWTRFRTAALAGDPAAVAALARFPFRTRGEMDDDPTRTHDRAAFAALLPRLLAQDPGLAAEPETVRDLIARTAVLPADALDADGRRARLGPLVFERAAGEGGWRLAMAYLADGD